MSKFQREPVRNFHPSPAERCYCFPGAWTFRTPSSLADAPDPRDAPAYSLAEVARYLRIAPTTLRSWASPRPDAPRGGAPRVEPLIRLANVGGHLVSFTGLVEAHVLRGMRTAHRAPISARREALDDTGRALGIGHLPLHQVVRTRVRDLVLRRYGDLAGLSPAGQLALHAALETYLSRIDWDQDVRPLRLYPFVRTDVADAARHIAMDPAVGFGRPLVWRRGVSTRAIVKRLDAGEAVEQVAEDYDLDPGEVEEAIDFERPTAPTSRARPPAAPAR